MQARSSTHSAPYAGIGDDFVLPSPLEIPPLQYGTFPGLLPPDELAKLDQIGRDEHASPISTCWRKFRRVIEHRDGGTPDQLDAELGPKAGEQLRKVPLGLLDTRERQLVSDLRGYGTEISHWNHPTLSLRDAFASLERSLDAALRLSKPQAAALARLARWETESSDPRRLDARARGADALRRALRQGDGRGALFCMEIGESHDARSFDVELPPPELLKGMGIAGDSLNLLLGDARPSDGEAFRSAAQYLNVRGIQLHIGPAGRFSKRWMPESVVEVELLYDLHRGQTVAPQAFALASEAPRALERIVCVPPLTDAPGDAAPPPGWSLERGGLRRITAPDPHAALTYFLPEGGELAAHRWSRFLDRPAGGLLAVFLTALHRQLEELTGRPNAAALREQATVWVRRLVHTLADQPELLDAWQPELVVDAPCVDAKMKLLRDLDLVIGARTDIDTKETSGALLRLALMSAADRHVSLLDPSQEDIERGLALQALIDFRLAKITGMPMARTPRPHYRSIAGIRQARLAFGLGRDRREAGPSAKDWPKWMHQAVDKIIGDEVRAGFPGVRELLSSPDGPFRRLADRLLEAPAYQAFKASCEAEFLAAEERAESDDATPEDHARYARAQAGMQPDALAAQQLALMDDWLAPLRRAFPTPRSA